MKPGSKFSIFCCFDQSRRYSRTIGDIYTYMYIYRYRYVYIYMFWCILHIHVFIFMYIYLLYIISWYHMMSIFVCFLSIQSYVMTTRRIMMIRVAIAIWKKTGTICGSLAANAQHNTRREEPVDTQEARGRGETLYTEGYGNNSLPPIKLPIWGGSNNANVW